MARQLEFDRTEVLALAADAFWRAGYEALPAHEIADAMGLAKSSLYNTFGSKKKLFIESLDHYADSQQSKVVTSSKSDDVMKQLRQLLLEAVSDNNAGRGCLLVNTAAEFGMRDGEIHQHIKAGFERMREAFAALIWAGQKAEQINANLDPHQQAVILISAIAGLRVLAKGGFSEADLGPVVHSVLAGLTK